MEDGSLSCTLPCSGGLFLGESLQTWVLDYPELEVIDEHVVQQEESGRISDATIEVITKSMHNAPRISRMWCSAEKSWLELAVTWLEER